MGMFDYVKCEYRLPGNPTDVVQNGEFQTKDFDCLLDHYLITREGLLMKEDTLVPFTGAVDIYCSNVVGSGPGVYTANGEDEEWGDYTITFVEGQVVKVDIESVGRRPALKSNRHWSMETDEEKQEQRAIHQRAADLAQDPLLVGKEICLWWGTQDEGVMVPVLLRHKDQLVIQNGDDRLEIIQDFGVGRTFFASIEDGKRWNEIRKTAWARGKAEYDAIQLKGEADEKAE